MIIHQTSLILLITFRHEKNLLLITTCDGSRSHLMCKQDISYRYSQYEHFFSTDQSSHEISLYAKDDQTGALWDD